MSNDMNNFYSGSGIFATKTFTRGTPLLEYVGEVISTKEANERAQRPPYYSSYMMEIKPYRKWYCLCLYAVLVLYCSAIKIRLSHSSCI